MAGTRGSVVIDAGGGDDSPLSGAGDVTLAGGAGTDRAGARDGTDTCMSIEVPTSCEVLGP